MFDIGGAAITVRANSQEIAMIQGMRTTFGIGIVAVLGLSCFAAAVTIRVDHTSTTNGPGTASNWSNAWDNLQDALDYASNPENEVDEIWVADGTYVPTERTDPNDQRSVTFKMVDGVRVFGGFQGLSRPGGGETQLAQRNPALYDTILAGALPNTDPPEYAYHVVTAEDVGSGSRLNGFTVRDGHADGEDENANGGGLWVFGDSSPLIIRCRFTSNFAASAGGAARIDGPAEIQFDPVQFLACTFDNNSSAIDGGALSIDGPWAYANILNCLAYDNESGDEGAGSFAFIRYGLVEITNATITRNFANTSEDVGALHIVHQTGPPVLGHFGMFNSIIWGNSNLNGNAETAQISVIEFEGGVAYCDIQNLDIFANGNNVDVDPIFVDANNEVFSLQYVSLLLNTGDAARLDYDVHDIDDDNDTNERLPDRAMGNRQVNPGDCIDIGAFEQQTPGTANCGADITGPNGVPDGVVNVIDLLLVINRWATPGGVADLSPSPCGDGTVNVNDLLAILNGWGDCAMPPDGAPQSVEDCEDKCALMYGTSSPEYAACVEDCVRALCEAEILPPEDCP